MQLRRDYGGTSAARGRSITFHGRLGALLHLDCSFVHGRLELAKLHDQPAVLLPGPGGLPPVRVPLVAQRHGQVLQIGLEGCSAGSRKATAADEHGGLEIPKEDVWGICIGVLHCMGVLRPLWMEHCSTSRHVQCTNLNSHRCAS